MTRLKISDKQIIEALKATRGNVLLATKKFGMSSKWLYGRLAENQKLKDALYDAREIQIDRADFKLQKAIERGEPWAITFFLRTIGRDRGYGDAVDINNKGIPTPQFYNISILSIEKLKELEAILLEASNGKTD